MWWIPAAIVARVAYQAYRAHQARAREAAPAPPLLEERGLRTGPKVLLVGRTGAGKSSLINLIRGEALLPVGPIGSTTRWMEGVGVELAGQGLTLVDSPGIGEAGTDDLYRRGIEEWCVRNRSSLQGVVLVLQADAKGHADDKRFLAALEGVLAVRALIVLSQVDKLPPLREPFSRSEWSRERRRSSGKVRSVEEKIALVSAQFGVAAGQVIPVSAETAPPFNRAGLVGALGRLGGREGS